MNARFHKVLKQCASLSDACVARDTARRHVARPGIWLGPDTRSRALKSIVPVVWSKMGSPVVSRSPRERERESARRGKERGDTKTHRHTVRKALASLATYSSGTLERRESEDEARDGQHYRHGR